ncbi:EamA family transporter [Inquilinus sp. CAU 1745]|uniref:DMT family transporter n=1 Tax=Inquilinus sp. CAU 1745 TaxID=3140369 RepID=UPI00325B50CE
MSPARSTSTGSLYARGLLLSFTGMVVISPDGLILRTIGDAGTWDILFWRSLFMGISLSLALAVSERRNPIALWRGMGRMGWLSALALAGANLCFVAAIAQTHVANVLVILATMPLFGAVLGWLVLREAVRGRTWFAIALALAGIAIIFGGSIGGGTLSGDLTAVGCAFLHAVNLVILRRTKTPIMLPALALSGFIGAAMVLPFAGPLGLTAHDMRWLAFSGLVQMPLALFLFLSGTRYVPAAEVALFSLVETVLGPLWVWLAIGERPGDAALIGGSIVMSAIVANSVLALKGDRRRPAEA